MHAKCVFCLVLGRAVNEGQHFDEVADDVRACLYPLWSSAVLCFAVLPCMTAAVDDVGVNLLFVPPSCGRADLFPRVVWSRRCSSEG